MISRRDLLKQFAIVGSGALAPAGRELRVTTISPWTTRLSLVATGASAQIAGDG